MCILLLNGIIVPNAKAVMLSKETGGYLLNDTTKLTVIGIDIAKNVFQVHGVNPEDSKIQRLKLSRSKFLLHFSNLTPCLVAMEACSGAHHWARELTKLGHQVKLLATKMAKPFVTGNKNDARAIWRVLVQ